MDLILLTLATLLCLSLAFDRKQPTFYCNFAFLYQRHFIVRVSAVIQDGLALQNEYRARHNSPGLTIDLRVLKHVGLRSGK